MVATGVAVITLAGVLVAQSVTRNDEDSGRRNEVATPQPQVWQTCWKPVRTTTAKIMEKPRESPIAVVMGQLGWHPGS